MSDRKFCLRHLKGPVNLLACHGTYGFIVSADRQGGLELWLPKPEEDFPNASSSNCPLLKYTGKIQTDYYSLAKEKTFAQALAISNDGLLLAVLCHNKKVKLFRISSGKCVNEFDLTKFEVDDPNLSTSEICPRDMDRRRAIEKDIRADSRQTIAFDPSSTYLLVPTVVGIRIINVKNFQFTRHVIGGKEPGLRYMTVTLSPTPTGIKKLAGIVSSTAEATKQKPEPLLLATALGKNRYY